MRVRIIDLHVQIDYLRAVLDKGARHFFRRIAVFGRKMAVLGGLIVGIGCRGGNLGFKILCLLSGGAICLLVRDVPGQGLTVLCGSELTS